MSLTYLSLLPGNFITFFYSSIATRHKILERIDGLGYYYITTMRDGTQHPECDRPRLPSFDELLEYMGDETMVVKFWKGLPPKDYG